MPSDEAPEKGRLMRLDTKPTALLVEDELLIAVDLEDAFSRAAFAPVTVSSTEQALDWLRRSTPSVAVLDVRLGENTAVDIALALREKGVPFVVHTAGSDLELPAEFRGTPVFLKPADYDDMITALRRLVAIS